MTGFNLTAYARMLRYRDIIVDNQLGLQNF